MKLYHGTNVEFGKIDLLKSKPNKDFGRGFYLSADYAQAKDMAEIKVEQLEFGSPFVLEYVNGEKCGIHDAICSFHGTISDDLGEFEIPPHGGFIMQFEFDESFLVHDKNITN